MFSFWRKSRSNERYKEFFRNHLFSLSCDCREGWVNCLASADQNLFCLNIFSLQPSNSSSSSHPQQTRHDYHPRIHLITPKFFYVVVFHRCRIPLCTKIEFQITSPKLGSGSNTLVVIWLLQPATILSRTLMKTNLSFLNKFEEDAYQKLISGLNDEVRRRKFDATRSQLSPLKFRCGLKLS